MEPADGNVYIFSRFSSHFASPLLFPFKFLRLKKSRGKRKEKKKKKKKGGKKKKERKKEETEKKMKKREERAVFPLLRQLANQRSEFKACSIFEETFEETVAEEDPNTQKVSKERYLLGQNTTCKTSV